MLFPLYPLKSFCSKPLSRLQAQHLRGVVLGGVILTLQKGSGNIEYTHSLQITIILRLTRLREN